MLDEIEKAHADVLNILLQVMDAGRLTDSKGHIVNFKNTLIIMTSNIGSELMLEQKIEPNSIQKRLEISKYLKKHFKMEFINRIDDIILFEHLSKNDMIKILDYQILSLNKLIKNKNILINLNNEAKDWIIREGYDYEYGARPLNRAIKKYINDPLAKMIISKKIIDGNINISVENEKLNFGL